MLDERREPETHQPQPALLSMCVPAYFLFGLDPA